jgi:predicted dehydrogenase
MNPESDTVDDFADTFDIEDVYRGEGWKEMIDEDRWDAVVIATHHDGLPEALTYSSSLEVPILVEKPVAWTSSKIRAIREQVHDEIIVGYNRRYYKPVEKGKEFLAEHRPVIATLELPETETTIKQFLSMSCHGIDMIRYLLGEVSVLDTHELTDNGELRGYVGTMRSESGDLINVIGNWEAPANMGINLDYQDKRFQIKPYEQAHEYEGFNMKEPTEETPVRRYIPKEVEKTNIEPVDGEFKPGFYHQAKKLKQLLSEGTVPSQSATLYDAQRAIELCERLLPERLPEEAPGHRVE